MGQKVSPKALRLGISVPWDTYFYANSGDYASKLLIDNKARELINKSVERGLISRVVTEYKSSGVLIRIFASKVGSVIGKGAENVTKMEDKLALIIKLPVRIEVVEVKSPACDATLIATYIAMQLEKRAPFRRVMKKSMSLAMKSRGCKGIKIACTGRLAGAEIARTEWYKEGRITLHTLKAHIDYACVDAHTAYGAIGVKVWVYLNDSSQFKKNDLFEENFK